MSDINVSMTSPLGVTLATAGKYCPDNVKVTPVLQSKSVNITSNGTTTIIPDSGKVGISIVSVTTDIPQGSLTSKQFTYTSAAAVAQQYVTVVSGDADVAAHYADADAMVVVRKMTNNTSNGLGVIVGTNHSYGTSYGVYMNYNGTANNALGIGVKMSETNSQPSVRCTSDGNIIVRCNSMQNNFGGADYIITFSW